MARKIPVVLDTFRWDTQGAAEDAFRKILRSSGYGLYDRITSAEHDKMLREVLDRHPDKVEKIGPGVAFFFIGRTIEGSNRGSIGADAIGIWIQRTDGTKVDFSYLTAIRSIRAKSDAKECLRFIVDAQRIAYRDWRFAQTTPAISDLSGLPIEKPDQASVIYLSPTWGQLTYRFAQIEGGWDKLKVHSGRGSVQIGGLFVDPSIEARWIEFHRNHAKLGLAKESEGNSRSRVDEAAWTPDP